MLRSVDLQCTRAIAVLRFGCLRRGSLPGRIARIFSQNPVNSHFWATFQLVGLFCTIQLAFQLSSTSNGDPISGPNMDELSSLSFSEKRRVHQEMMAATNGGGRRNGGGLEEDPPNRGKLLKSPTNS